MTLRTRILRIEKMIPDTQQKQELSDIEQVVEWLIQNNEEYLECVRQLFRLQCRAGQHADNWEQWREPYKQHAISYLNRINELIQEHKASVRARDNEKDSTFL